MKHFISTKNFPAFATAMVASFTALSLTIGDASASAKPATASESPIDRSVLPIVPQPFSGVIGETIGTSKPAWSRTVATPVGAPNVLLMMTDDVGFGATSTFGGPVPTPNLDRLARMGLRYTRFHTTGVCSPSRAALLTGRNHHAVGAGMLVDGPTGFPGYHGAIPKSAATIARVLTGNGYASAFYGKHHNVPSHEASAAGPFDRWPTGLGFEHFLGFIGGDVHQFSPHLYRGTQRVRDAANAPREHLDQRLTDDGIRWIRNLKSSAPNKPFFMYVATGAGHGPYHAPPEWLEKFRGKFDRGWDAIREQTFREQKKAGLIPQNTSLAARPDKVPSWKTLSPTMQRVSARFMEAFAAHVAFQDAQFGRLLDELERMGELDNTLVIFIEGDNGGTAQNGLRPSENEIGAISNKVSQTEEQFAERLHKVGQSDSYSVFSAGWGFAINTPFPWFKHIGSHLGGTRNGMVLAWPERIKDHGTIRTTFAHLTDVLPTILDAASIPPPIRVDGIEQQRLDGVSLVPTFGDPKVAGREIQYFELDGNRAIYHKGWLASTTPVHMPWEREGVDEDMIPQWTELYDLRSDFSQSLNLAQQFPEKLRELAAIWDKEAKANNVYPIDVRQPATRMTADLTAPSLANFKPSATFWGKGVSVISSSAPPLALGSFKVVASIKIYSAKETGVIFAGGSKFGGWTLFFKEGKPVVIAATSQLPQDQFEISAKSPLEPGEYVLSYGFDRDGGPLSGGTVTISVNGEEVASGRVGRSINTLAGLGETWDVGDDTGVLVSEKYAGSVEFPGEIDVVRMELTGLTPRMKRRTP